MIPVRIKDYNTHFSPPDDMDECGGLYVRAERQGDETVLLSAWKPSPIELEVLKRGGSVILGIVGNGHPPVTIYASKE